MHRFADNCRRTWRVHVDYAAVVRVRDLVGVDLLDPAAGTDDAEIIVDVLYACCHPEAEARGVSDRNFGGAFNGKVFVAAEQALAAEWLQFFPAPDPKREKPDQGPGLTPEEVDRLIWHLAGTVGVHPAPFTLRQLLAMAEGRNRAAWLHTSAVIAMLVNTHRDPKKTPVPSSKFDPYAATRVGRVREQVRQVSFDLFFADLIDTAAKAAAQQRPN